LLPGLPPGKDQAVVIVTRGRLQRATVKVTLALWLSDPEVPINSMVEVPSLALREALKVIVTFALPFAGGVTGLAVAVADTPLGNALALNSTAEWKPFWLVMVRVTDPLPLSSMVREEGETAMVKFAVPPDALTVRAMVVL
jgi:hypothetical protein